MSVALCFLAPQGWLDLVEIWRYNQRNRPASQLRTALNPPNREKNSFSFAGNPLVAGHSRKGFDRRKM